MTGHRWVRRTPSQSQLAWARQQGLPDVVTRVLASRVPDQPSPSWLRPDLDVILAHAPGSMHGMSATIDRLRKALRDREKIFVVTDYDVDGTTSSLILQHALHLAGGGAADLAWHIPDRFTEGYGFRPVAADKARELGCSLVVTADIGVRDHDAIDRARSLGLDVLVCDHHLPAEATVPENATAVLCPPQRDCTYPNPALAACGVSLKVAQALLADHPKRERLLRSFLKLAAIGTVADVVDLSTPENRAIVSLGLQELSRGPHSAGLAALLDVAGVAGRPLRADDLGFRIGPASMQPDGSSGPPPSWSCSTSATPNGPWRWRARSTRSTPTDELYSSVWKQQRSPRSRIHHHRSWWCGAKKTSKTTARGTAVSRASSRPGSESRCTVRWR